MHDGFSIDGIAQPTTTRKFENPAPLRNPLSVRMTDFGREMIAFATNAGSLDANVLAS
jgi:hypothetical protein